MSVSILDHPFEGPFADTFSLKNQPGVYVILGNNGGDNWTVVDVGESGDLSREPVREWLRGLDPGDRRIVGEDIKDVEFAWLIGMSLVRPLGRGLREVRLDLV